MSGFRRVNQVFAILLGLTIVACGGGGGGTATTAPTDPGSAATSGPTEASATDAPATNAPATVAPATAAPAPTQPPAGGGGAAGVCELVTPEELAEIFGVPSVNMTVLPGPPDNCIVDSESGDPVTAWSLTTAQAAVVFGAFTTDPSTVEVSGVGDKAAIVQNTGLLVLKGGSLLVIMISSGADMSEDEAIEASKQIGILAAGRL